jgi:putative methyltransferase (TIGR04325 family)
MALIDWQIALVLSSVRRLFSQANRSQIKYSSWNSALAASSPYETDLEIFGWTAREIRSGSFDPNYDFLVSMAGILLPAEPVDVLDLGGGLAFGYFAMNRYIPEVIKSWTVVELKPVCDYGNAELADGKLRFIENISQAAKSDILLANGVLQALESPYLMLDEAIKVVQPKVIVFEKLPIDKSERFTIQKLSASAGGNSFPYRSVTEGGLAKCLVGYSLVREIKMRPDNPAVIPERYLARIYRRNQ